MAMASGDYSVQVGSGEMKGETQEFTWEIQNFPALLSKDCFDSNSTGRRAVDSKYFDFSAGKTLGSSSNWRVYLKAYGNYFVGIHFRLMSKQKSDSDPGPVPVLASCSFSVTSGKRKTDLIPASAFCKWGNMSGERMKEPSESGYPGFLWTATGSTSTLEKIVDPDGSLKIGIIFTIYPTPTPRYEVVQKKLERFNSSGGYFWGFMRGAAEKCWNWPWEEWEGDARTKVKIISRDGEPFYAWKEELVVRSSVFEAMLDRLNWNKDQKAMVEVNLPDISRETLRILLHYLSLTELLPGWEEEEVILELTFAAGKYMLNELLQFLDGVLGKVCTKGNVQELILLAEGLDLVNVEEELMAFFVEETETWLDSKEVPPVAPSLPPPPPNSEFKEEKEKDREDQNRSERGGRFKGLLELFIGFRRKRK